jgi:predicted GNAT family acetyltransferase
MSEPGKPDVTPASGPAIGDNAALQRFELQLDGATAFVSYRRTADAVWLTHAEVPAALRGRGLGDLLVRGVLERLRAQGDKIVAQCPFVAVYIQRHPEFAPLLASRP